MTLERGALAPGVQFAGYRVERVIGRGGMGVVYEVMNLSLGRREVLKVVAPHLGADDEFRARFKREARLAAALHRHPNVVTIHYAGEQDGVLYLAMDLIEGRDLRVLMREEGPLEPKRAGAIVAAVASALDAAHASGLVHRDVKPANILLAKEGDGEYAYLSDFGLTKRTDSTTNFSRTGVIVGTVDYMAPEQIRGHRVDARTDVYALGCVLFEMLTGTPPFARELEHATMFAHLEEPPPSACALRPTLDRAIDAVVARAIAKEPDDRYASAGDLWRDFAAALGGERYRGAATVVATGAAAPPVTESQGPPPSLASDRDATSAREPGDTARDLGSPASHDSDLEHGHHGGAEPLPVADPRDGADRDRSADTRPGGDQETSSPRASGQAFVHGDGMDDSSTVLSTEPAADIPVLQPDIPTAEEGRRDAAVANRRRDRRLAGAAPIAAVAGLLAMGGYILVLTTLLSVHSPVVSIVVLALEAVGAATLGLAFVVGAIAFSRRLAPLARWSRLGSAAFGLALSNVFGLAASVTTAVVALTHHDSTTTVMGPLFEAVGDFGAALGLLVAGVALRSSGRRRGGASTKLDNQAAVELRDEQLASVALILAAAQVFATADPIIGLVSASGLSGGVLAQGVLTAVANAVYVAAFACGSIAFRAARSGHELARALQKRDRWLGRAGLAFASGYLMETAAGVIATLHYSNQGVVGKIVASAALSAAAAGLLCIAFAVGGLAFVRTRRSTASAARALD